MARILIVDDEQDVLDTVALVLRHEKHTVLTALDGKSALGIIERESLDLLIVDIRMTPMHGLEVIARTRVRKPTLPVIVISAFNDEDVINRAMDMGCAKFVEKPLTLKKLLSSLREVLADAEAGADEEMAANETAGGEMGWIV